MTYKENHNFVNNDIKKEIIEISINSSNKISYTLDLIKLEYV